MTDLTTLQSLRDRVAKATGPDREIDADVAVATGLFDYLLMYGFENCCILRGKYRDDDCLEVIVRHPDRPDGGLSYQEKYQHLTSSIDAALVWVGRVLPELHLYGISIVAGNPVSGDWYLYHRGHELRGFISGQTLPLAIIMTGLDAMVAKKEVG
jgi:hypothetical protein